MRGYGAWLGSCNLVHLSIRREISFAPDLSMAPKGKAISEIKSKIMRQNRRMRGSRMECDKEKMR